MLFSNVVIAVLTYCAGLSVAARDKPAGHLSRRDADNNAADNIENEQASTTYNGIEVPVMTMLNGETLNDDIKGGYW